jgi:hypothetical protein
MRAILSTCPHLITAAVASSGSYDHTRFPGNSVASRGPWFRNPMGSVHVNPSQDFFATAADALYKSVLGVPGGTNKAGSSMLSQLFWLSLAVASVPSVLSGEHRCIRDYRHLTPSSSTARELWLRRLPIFPGT